MARLFVVVVVALVVARPCVVVVARARRRLPRATVTPVANFKKNTSRKSHIHVVLSSL
jgi:hypothetical protein